MPVEVNTVADINLDFLPPEQREFLRRRAEERGSTVEEELERALDEVMEGAVTESDPLQEEVRKEIDGSPPEDLAGIVGVLKGPDPVTSENFHDYLYGEREED